MEDVARLPYCAAVPPPYSEQADPLKLLLRGRPVSDSEQQ